MWYLVRHPETEWNRQRRYQGWLNVPLSAQGQEQCSQLIAELAQLSAVQAVLSSDLDRCLAVALPLAERLHMSVQSLPQLRELDFGAWEGLTFDEIKARYPELQTSWLACPTEVSPPGGETLSQLTKRVRQALEPYLRSNVVIVTHGGVIAAILRLWIGEEFRLPATGSCLAVDLQRRQYQQLGTGVI